jgi:hypothetical protein
LGPDAACHRRKHRRPPAMREAFCEGRAVRRTATSG